jgi:hypothetical protein
MYSSPRPGRFALAAAASLVAAACASLTINSFVERGIDFRLYRTYTWGPSETLSTGDPRLDNNRFFHERLQADVEKALGDRGFEKATSRTPPDLTIHYHTSVTQRVDPNGADQKYGYCDECEPYVYDAGTLVIDLVDTRTNKVVWRGWAEGSMDGVVDNQKWMEQKVDDAVARIMARLPSSV